MAYTQQPISKRLTLHTQDGYPGSLGVNIDSGARTAEATFLTPSEADQLVLHALGMTKPEVLDGPATAAYGDAVNAVRTWQRHAAEIWQQETLDAERNRILRDANIGIAYDNATQGARALVDMVIAERRKAEQK